MFIHQQFRSGCVSSMLDIKSYHHLIISFSDIIVAGPSSIPLSLDPTHDMISGMRTWPKFSHCLWRSENMELRARLDNTAPGVTSTMLRRSETGYRGGPHPVSGMRPMFAFRLVCDSHCSRGKSGIAEVQSDQVSQNVNIMLVRPHRREQQPLLQAKQHRCRREPTLSTKI